MSLLERTRTGLRELPSNAAWLLSGALKPADAIRTVADSATAGALDRGRKVGAAVIDAAPVGGDSVEIRMRRAQDATEQAREAEDRAVEAARESKALADRARQVDERGRARVKDVDRELSRYVQQRVAEAQKAAEEFVKRERQAAEADAKEQRQEVQEEVDTESEEAQRDAEASRERAEELVEEATEALAEARRLADEAAEAARAAAEEAKRQAQQLANEADSRHVTQRDASKQPRKYASTPWRAAKQTARQLNRDTTNGGLKSYKKPELVELAASVGIKQRTSMTKGELVDALTKAARKR